MRSYDLMPGSFWERLRRRGLRTIGLVVNANICPNFILRLKALQLHN